MPRHPQPTTDPFGTRLREARADAGLSQVQLAARLGVFRPAVSRWEAGIRRPSWNNLMALSRILDIRLGQLFDG